MVLIILVIAYVFEFVYLMGPRLRYLIVAYISLTRPCSILRLFSADNLNVKFSDEKVYFFLIFAQNIGSRHT